MHHLSLHCNVDHDTHQQRHGNDNKNDVPANIRQHDWETAATTHLHNRLFSQNQLCDGIAVVRSGNKYLCHWWTVLASSSFIWLPYHAFSGGKKFLRVSTGEREKDRRVLWWVQSTGRWCCSSCWLPRCIVISRCEWHLNNRQKLTTGSHVLSHASLAAEEGSSSFNCGGVSMYRRCCDDPTILSDDDRETTITAAWSFAYQLLFLLSSFSWVPHTRWTVFVHVCKI